MLMAKSEQQTSVDNCIGINAKILITNEKLVIPDPMASGKSLGDYYIIISNSEIEALRFTIVYCKC